MPFYGYAVLICRYFCLRLRTLDDMVETPFSDSSMPSVFFKLPAHDVGDLNVFREAENEGGMAAHLRVETTFHSPHVGALLTVAHLEGTQPLGQ